MQVNPSLDNAAATAAAPAPRASRRVTDAPTRMFHWLFALSFLGAYLTAEGERWRALHVTLGYTLAGLLVFRLLYGLLGPRPVSLRVLWAKVAGLPNWLKAFGRGLPPPAHWRQGQNLLMGLAIVVLLALVVPLTLSGYATYNDWGGDWLEEVHEFVGNTFLAVVLAHLALLVTLSVARRRNIALPMITGRMAGAGPDLVKNRRWLAALVLLAVLAFGAWQWQQSPQGLLPAQGAAARGHQGGHHEGRGGHDD